MRLHGSQRTCGMGLARVGAAALLVCALMSPRLLRIPAWLAVTAIGCGAEGGDDTATVAPSTESASATASSSGSDSTGESSSSTVADTGTTSDDASTTSSGGGSSSGDGTSSSETSSGTGESSGLPDCLDIDDPDTCAATVGCLFDSNLELCNVDCSLILDQATCVMQSGVCFWMDRTCQQVAI